MNKDWSDKNKKMQALIGKEATFDAVAKPYLREVSIWHRYKLQI